MHLNISLIVSDDHLWKSFAQSVFTLILRVDKTYSCAFFLLAVCVLPWSSSHLKKKEKRRRRIEDGVPCPLVQCRENFAARLVSMYHILYIVLVFLGVLEGAKANRILILRLSQICALFPFSLFAVVILIFFPRIVTFSLHWFVLCLVHFYCFLIFEHFLFPCASQCFAVQYFSGYPMARIIHFLRINFSKVNTNGLHEHHAISCHAGVI